MVPAEPNTRDYAANRTGYATAVEKMRLAGGGLPIAVDARLPATPRRTRRPTGPVQFLGIRIAAEGQLSAEHGHGRAFLFVPVCLGVGAIHFFELPADPPPAALVAGFLLALAAAVVCRYRHAVLTYGTMAAALVLAGMLLAQVETWRRSTVILDTAVTTTVSGVVERRESNGGGHWRYIVRLHATEQPALRRAPALVSLLARSRHAPIAIGATISGRVRLSPPSGPALPQLHDFAFSAFFDGIGAVGYFYGPPSGRSLPGAATLPHAGALQALLLSVYRLRGSIGDRIRTMVPGDAGAFAAAIVTDERRAISRETTDALRLSGLAHIVAISGLNMALAAGIFFVGVRAVLSLFVGFAQAHSVKKIAAVGALATACAYYLISGFAVSAERAFLMMAIMLVAVFFDRPSISLRNVALSAIAILVVSPSEVLGPSFQMSFAATLALVAGYALWKDRRAHVAASRPAAVLSPAIAVLKFFGGIFLTSLIGGVATAVFSIEHFHKLATYGLPANLAAMPIISFIVMPAGLVAMLLMPLGLDAVPLTIMGFGLDLVIAIAKTVAGWGGEVAFGRLHPWFFPTAVAGILLLTLLKTRLRHAGTALIVCAGVLAAASGTPAPADLVVSEDGRLAAIDRDGVLRSNRRKPPNFIFAQWQRALLRTGHDPPIRIVPSAADMRAEVADTRRRRAEKLTPAEVDGARSAIRLALRDGEPDRFSCLDKRWCVARLSAGAIIAVLEDPAYVGAACDTAGVVIVPARLRFKTCRSGAILLSADVLRRTGVLELRFFAAATGRSPQLTTALQAVDRPWTRHRRYDWRSGAFDNETPAAVQALLNDSGG